MTRAPLGPLGLKVNQGETDQWVAQVLLVWMGCLAQLVLQGCACLDPPGYLVTRVLLASLESQDPGGRRGRRVMRVCQGRALRDPQAWLGLPGLTESPVQEVQLDPKAPKDWMDYEGSQAPGGTRVLLEGMDHQD